MKKKDLILFTGSSNFKLANRIAEKLNISLGLSKIYRFSDGEIMVEIKENVRGKEVFVLQSLNYPVNDNLMEMLIIIDALKRASVSCITAIIPYFGYARQDRRSYLSRTAITSKVVANILENSGINRILFMDLHSEQIQGFFNIPIDNIYASRIFLKDIIKKKYKNFLIVSPDFGGIVRARYFVNKLNCNLVIIDKYRYKINTTKVMNILGIVKNYICIIIDDIVDTAGTLLETAKSLKSRGAKKVIAYCTHPVLSGSSLKNIENSFLDELVVTDTIKLENIEKYKKIRQLTCANLLSKSLKRIILGGSIISLFV